MINRLIKDSTWCSFEFWRTKTSQALWKGDLSTIPGSAKVGEEVSFCWSFCWSFSSRYSLRISSTFFLMSTIFIMFLSLTSHREHFFCMLIDNVSTKGDGEDLRLLPDARGLYLLQLDVARHGIKLTCWHENDHSQKMFRPQVQIMYYAGYRVLPEAPLREDWVQVINAI